MFPWAASGRSLAIGRDEGFTKLLFDPETHRVIGGGIVGTNAGDLIAEVGLAIEMGADAADIGLTIHPHPDAVRNGRDGGRSVRRDADGPLRAEAQEAAQAQRELGRAAQAHEPGTDPHAAAGSACSRRAGAVGAARAHARRPRALPDAVIIGAQKCGTSRCRTT